MVSAIIVAAGKGTRMGPNIDKLFLEVAGRPVVAHTWERFVRAREVDEIVVVVREGMQSAFEELASQYKLGKPFRLVAGGAERQDSVWTGLEAVSSAAGDCGDPGWGAALHERGVDFGEVTIAAAREFGAAVAGQPVTDTIKETADGKMISADAGAVAVVGGADAANFSRGGDPTGARRGCANWGRLPVTDDTAACELIGQAVKLVASGAPNPKVTVPADLAYIELLLRVSA